MSNTIMFCFGGRRANLELQLPFIHRILRDNPDIEYHLWNLARSRQDYVWIKSLQTSERFKVMNDYHGSQPWTRFNDVYRYYCRRSLRGNVFIKLDDDVVFLESQRICEFTEDVRIHGGSIVSACVVNNGACTKEIPPLWKYFTEQLQQRHPMPLLDVHQHYSYALMCHTEFIHNWRFLVDRPAKLVSTEDWLSINFIGMDWSTLVRFVANLGEPSARHIAGRDFPRGAKMGDEGVANLMPRLISHGFTASHLYFGPQLRRAGEIPFQQYRNQYAPIGRAYREG